MELGLSLGSYGNRRREEAPEDEVEMEEEDDFDRSSGEPPVQLTLLPLTPVIPRYHNNSRNTTTTTFDFDVNRLPCGAEESEEGSLNSQIGRGAGERVSDEEENGMARNKKLRLSKEQSAFLEESFKEHNTLNPKQKQALANQLNLRPRQVEVWFQNRRARTKLKQTEVDCEYLKRCCETLTEENRRLQKELSELRALKTASHPFFMQLPATTLSMCPSCERTTTTTGASNAGAGPAVAGGSGGGGGGKMASLFGKQRFYPFATSPAS